VATASTSRCGGGSPTHSQGGAKLIGRAQRKWVRPGDGLIIDLNRIGEFLHGARTDRTHIFCARDEQHAAQCWCFVGDPPEQGEVVCYGHKKEEAVAITYRPVPAPTEEKTRMKPGEARALMRQVAEALQEAERLEEKYGPDRADGTVIRFRKSYTGRVFDSITFPTLTEEARRALEEENSYLYAAVRAGGKWFLTGPSQAGLVYEWEDLLDFLDEGVAVTGVEVWPPRSTVEITNASEESTSDSPE